MNRILLISARQREALRIQIALLAHGLTVELASSFRRGLAIARRRPPTAIILDETIPEFDGRQFATAVSREHIPVVLVPGESQPAETQLVEALRRKGIV